MLKNFKWIGLILLLSLTSSAGETNPKYGSHAIPLSQENEFFRRAPAQHFWSLIPYYAAQQKGWSCSVATTSMLVNAARSKKTLTSDDPLATEADLIKRVKSSEWGWGFSFLGSGVTLDQLGELLKKSFKAYDIELAGVSVVHIDNLNPETQSKLHEDLVKSEKSEKEYILINFLQGVFTGDADVGHFAPIAAYDPEKKRALVMDPDRKWYEPYWVSEEILLKGMATLDKQSGKNRGYIRLTLP